MSSTRVYCSAGPIDTLLQSKEAYLRQYELRQLQKRLEDGESPSKVAVEIVKCWLLSNSHEHDYGDGNVRIFGGMEVTQFDEKYKNEPYWKEHCSIKFWDELFQEDRRYREVDIAERIPNDEYQCMVFHFVHKWSERFREFFCDGDVSPYKKVALLKKQMRNIAVFSKERAFGSFWHMMSKPDDTLKQALAGGGGAVPVRDCRGNHKRDIMGRRQYAEAFGIKSATGDGPKPDDTDKMLYTSISKHAEYKTTCKPPKQWTMVRSSFKTDEQEVRCYAFSGSSGSNKQLHKIPEQWWKTNKYKDAFFKENRDIYVCNVDQKRLSQNMILAVFNALQESILRDLASLTTHIAFDDKQSSESLILHTRNDLVTLDYGEYYDIVISRMNRADDSITHALTTNEYLKTNFGNTEELVKEIWTMVSVGGKNKKFEPKLDELKSFKLKSGGCLDETAVDVIGSISKSKLDKLKQDLEGLPTKFLIELKKRIEKCHCGEDNVLSLLLQKYLETVTVSGKSPVEFVALDGDNPGGKPFCEVCDRKVRFYSVLPNFLQELGVSGKDDESGRQQRKELLSQLTTLFAKMAENP